MYVEKGCRRLFQNASTKILLYLMATGHTVAPRSKAPFLNITVYSLLTHVPSGKTRSGVVSGLRTCSTMRLCTSSLSFDCMAERTESGSKGCEAFCKLGGSMLMTKLFVHAMHALLVCRPQCNIWRPSAVSPARLRQCSAHCTSQWTKALHLAALEPQAA